MLHRHFNGENSSDNLTTLADVTPKVDVEKFVSENFPPIEPVDAPRKRGRKPRMGE